MRRAPGSQEAHGEAGRALNPRLVCMDFIRGWGHHMHKGKLPEDKTNQQWHQARSRGLMGGSRHGGLAACGSESSPPRAPCHRPVAGTTSGFPRSTAGFSP